MAENVEKYSIKGCSFWAVDETPSNKQECFIITSYGKELDEVFEKALDLHIDGPRSTLTSLVDALVTFKKGFSGKKSLTREMHEKELNVAKSFILDIMGRDFDVDELGIWKKVKMADFLDEADKMEGLSYSFVRKE